MARAKKPVRKWAGEMAGRPRKSYSVKIGEEGRVLLQMQRARNARLKAKKTKKAPAFNKAGKPRKARPGLKGALDG